MLNQIPDEAYLDMFDDDDTDSESSDSHDDDISIVVKSSDSFTAQKKIFRKKTNHEDLITDFNKEMENELCDTVLESMRKLSGSGNFQKTEVIAATASSQSSDGVPISVGDPRPSSSVKNGGKCERYDDIYFDSDEEIEKKEHRVLSNDELFYDPEMDKIDQMWMDERRLNPHMLLSSQKRTDNLFKKNSENTNSLSNNKRKKSKSRRVPTSDAILDCPACMTTICIDCQKHDRFPNQYRAMFVMNCTIDFTERFRYPQSTGKEKKQKVGFNDDDDSSKIPLDDEKDDVFYSVKCDECNTQVAMYDKDEVYHFFNIISSYG